MDNLPLLLESICIRNQEIQLLDYHNTRANNARKDIYKDTSKLDFSEFIDVKQAKDAVVKCRIVYGKKIESIEYQSYSLKSIKSLKILKIDPFWNYKYKYLDRSNLDNYFAERGQADDMIMVQNGFVTDSYYGNLAFLSNGKWYTPQNPLLKGTKRAYLIDESEIIERIIRIEEIDTFESIRIFNAMIDFGQVELMMDAVKK